eukprot:10421860-Prorocentrum_lima.AAC.1
MVGGGGVRYALPQPRLGVSSQKYRNQYTLSENWALYSKYELSPALERLSGDGWRPRWKAL